MKYFWRMVGLNLISFFVIVGAVLIIIGIIVIAFVVAVPLGFISLIPMIPIGFMVILMLGNSFILAERALVVRNAGVFNAISEGFNLFMANKVNNFILFLINLGLGIAVFICTMIILLIIAIPFIALGLFTGPGWIIGLVIGIPIFLLIMLPFSGFLGAVFEGINTLFYFRLVEPQGIQPDQPDSPYQPNPPYQSA